MAGTRSVRLITLVRDPVAVQVSWFFFGLQRWLKSRRKIEADSIKPDQLRDVFFDHFPREGVLNWFQEEWCHLTGVPLEDLDRVREDGFAAVDFGPHHACIMHAHASDEDKQAWLEDWLGLPTGSVRFPRTNVARPRSDEASRTIMAAVGADRELLDRAYGSDYARTFFRPDTIDAWRARWEKHACEL